MNNGLVLSFDPSGGVRNARQFSLGCENCIVLGLLSHGFKLK